jgi:hypothetical protein
VLQPIRTGQPVGYRPPGWEFAHLLDAVVWVQSDYAEAERRGIARDVASGVNGDRVAAAAFWHSWMAEELRFLEHQRPWERAAASSPERHSWPTAVTKSSSRCLLADTTPLAPPAHDAADPVAAGHGAWTCSSADTGRLAIHIYRWFRVS